MNILCEAQLTVLTKSYNLMAKKFAFMNFLNLWR